MAQLGSLQTALLLHQEVSNVVTAMREQTFRWSMVPTRYTRAQDEENGDDPLLEEFKLLRQRDFQYHDWSAVDPMEYLSPFLEVILSQDIGGHITSAALTAISHFLDAFILGAYAGSLDVPMRRIADAVTQCKFPSSGPSSNDVVLFKILQVLDKCVKCPGGHHLTDSNIINICNAYYRIGHFMNDPDDRSNGSKELLKAAARQVTVDLVGHLFGQLDSLTRAPELEPEPAPHAEPQPERSGPTEQPAMLASDPNGLAESAASARAQASQITTTSLLDTVPSTVSAEKMRQEPPYGVKAAHEVLGFIITLSHNMDDSEHKDLTAFGLELLCVALSHGKSGFAKHEELMELLRDDAWHALYQAVRTNQLNSFVAAGQITLYLWIYLGNQLLIQLEQFIRLFLLWLSRASKSSNTLFQEAALEVILDLCSQPNFIRSIFINLDCRVERTDLFEDICGHLSKTALPVNTPLGSIHINALEGLFSILHLLSKGCKGLASWEGMDEAFTNAEIAGIWEAYCSNRMPSPISRRMKNSTSEGDLDSPQARTKAKADEERKAAIETELLEKVLKNRLATAAEHFNLDYKKAFLYLQSVGLFEEKLNARAVARFLRKCPGLSKRTIGELLGEHSDFYLEVLDEFTKTFNFKGMTFDSAIRLFLESFRLPGEAQKINRIVESFGTYYHKQCPKLFKNADAVYIFAYSVILLNTDQHNSQVKKKMNAEDFIKNNRGINDGENLPEEFLRQLYDSISGNEIKISSDASAGHTSVDWESIARQSMLPRARLLNVNDLATPSLDRQIFALMWQPTIAAVSVVLDSADSPETIQHALDGLLSAAKIASFHRVNGVMDNMVASLSRFAATLDPANPKPALAFGENEKARRATQTMFIIANRYGDSLRSGWKQLLQIVMHIFQLDLLPPEVLALELDEQSKERLPRPFAKRSQSSGASLWSRALSSIIQIDTNESAEARPREAAASRNTAECIESCCIKDIFVDSKFLRAESLIELVKALLWAAGPVNRIAASGENSDVAEVGLELVIVVALRNRDRLMLIWPFVHDMLATILAPENARQANSLVRRATTGLLRVCRRLLHYKTESSAALLKSLHMVRKLDLEVAWKMAPDIAEEVLLLVENAGEQLRDPAAWSTITRLIISTSASPEARGTAMKALLLLSHEPILCPIGFLPCLESAATFMEKSNDPKSAEIGIQAIQALDNMFQWLARYKQQRQAAVANSPKFPLVSPGHSPRAAPSIAPVAITQTGQTAEAMDPQSGESSEPRQPDITSMWKAVTLLLYRASSQPLQYIRDRCLELLGKVFTSSSDLELGPEVWLDALQHQLLPMTHDFAAKLAGRKRGWEEFSPRFSLALKLTSKILLQYLTGLVLLPAFHDFWASVLQEFQDLTRLKNEEISEAVPEALKNILLVMNAKGILRPQWKDTQGNSLWDLTWHKAQVVSSGLTPALLGLVEEPRPTSPPVPPYQFSGIAVNGAMEGPAEAVQPGSARPFQQGGEFRPDQAGAGRPASAPVTPTAFQAALPPASQAAIPPPPPAQLAGVHPPANPLAPLTPLPIQPSNSQQNTAGDIPPQARGPVSPEASNGSPQIEGQASQSATAQEAVPAATEVPRNGDQSMPPETANAEHTGESANRESDTPASNEQAENSEPGLSSCKQS